MLFMHAIAADTQPVSDIFGSNSPNSSIAAPESRKNSAKYESTPLVSSSSKVFPFIFFERNPSCSAVL